MGLNLGSQLRQERHELADRLDAIAGRHSAVVTSAESIYQLGLDWIPLLAGGSLADMESMLEELGRALVMAKHADSLVSQALHDGLKRAKSHQIDKAGERIDLQAVRVAELDDCFAEACQTMNRIMSTYVAIPAMVERRQVMIDVSLSLADDQGLAGEHVAPTIEQLRELSAELVEIGDRTVSLDPVAEQERVHRIGFEVVECVHSLRTANDPRSAHREWGETLTRAAARIRSRSLRTRGDDRRAFGVTTDEWLSLECQWIETRIDQALGLIERASGLPTKNRDWDEAGGLLEAAGGYLVASHRQLAQIDRYLTLLVAAKRNSYQIVSSLATAANLARVKAEDLATDDLRLAESLQEAARELALRLNDDEPDYLAVARRADILGREASRLLTQIDPTSDASTKVALERSRDRARIALTLALTYGGGEEKSPYWDRVDELRSELDALTGDDPGDPERACQIAEQADAIYRSLLDRSQRRICWIELEDFRSVDSRLDARGCDTGVVGGGLRAGSFSDYREDGSFTGPAFVPFEG